MHQQQTAFENIVRKEEIARNEQFLLFPQCFLLNQIVVSPFVYIFDIIYLFAADLEEPKFGIWGKGLTTLKKKALENTVGKGKQMLVTSIFFFSHSVFYFIKEKNSHFSKL